MSEAVLELFRRAFLDVDFHRRLSKRGQDPKPLNPLQVHVARTVEELMFDGSGDTLTIRLPRQSGKNEISGQIHERHLLRCAGTGGCIVRAAPSFRPQLINSKRRLDKIARADPLFDFGSLRWREGYIAEYGAHDQPGSEIHFLSADEQARPEGATADVLLDLDEAHKVDPFVFGERFEPMTASTNAPKVMWGVAGCKDDLLYQEMQRNLELGLTHRVINVPARVVSEFNEIYRMHYEGRIKRLGADHPIVLTQYDLVDVDELGTAFSKYHRDQLFDSDFNRELRPTRRRAGQKYIAVIDVAGEEEEELDLQKMQEEGARQAPDCTTILICRIDSRRSYMDKPLFEIVDMKVWIGLKMIPAPGDAAKSLQERIMDTLQTWRPRVTLIDSRGIGKPLSSWIDRVWKGGKVVQYAASLATTTEDLYETWALLNTGQLRCFRSDGSAEYAELQRQLGWVVAKHTRDMVNLEKPRGSDRKIDLAKALTYLPRAAAAASRSRAWSFSARL